MDTAGNMLPSILISNIPYVGAYAGVAVLGLSAAGNAKAEMINLGYSKSDANFYGFMVGASEAGLQYLLGGISKLGGKASKHFIQKALSKVDNAFARVAITLGSKALSEASEEALQTAIEGWLFSIATGTDFEAPNIDEVLYSGLLGAIMGAFGDIDSTVSESTEVSRKGAFYKDLGLESDIVQEGIDTGVLTGKQAEKYTKKAASEKGLSKTQLGVLDQNLESNAIEKDKSRIQSAVKERLTQLEEIGNI
jgi:hypothetical protein